MMNHPLFCGGPKLRVVTAKDVEERLRRTREAVYRWRQEVGGCEARERRRTSSLGVEEESEDEALQRLESWWSSQSSKEKDSPLQPKTSPGFNNHGSESEKSKPFQPPSIPIDIDEDETFFEVEDDDIPDSGLVDSGSRVSSGLPSSQDRQEERRKTRVEEELRGKLQEQTKQFMELKQEVREVQTIMKEFVAKMSSLETAIGNQNKEKGNGLEKVDQNLTQMLVRVGSTEEGEEDEIVVPPTPPRGPIELHNGVLITQEEYNDFYRGEYHRLKKQVERKKKDPFYSPVRTKISEYVDFVSPLRKKLNLTDEECDRLRRPMVEAKQSSVVAAAKTSTSLQTDKDHACSSSTPEPPGASASSTVKDGQDDQEHASRATSVTKHETLTSPPPASKPISVVPSITEVCGGTMFAAFLASLNQGNTNPGPSESKEVQSPEMPILEPMAEENIKRRHPIQCEYRADESDDDCAQKPTFNIKRSRGRPRKDASLRNNDESDDDCAREPKFKIKRSRGRPRKDASLHKIQKIIISRQKESTHDVSVDDYALDPNFNIRWSRGRPRKIKSLAKLRNRISSRKRNAKNKKVHDINLSNVGSQSEVKLRDRKSFICYTCGATFSTKSILYEHQSDTHDILMLN